ncbi:MAG: phytanoyl-CoA dioxygenase family protein [Actinomycetota bacterium]
MGDADVTLLTTSEMANFVADGVLVFPGIVPDDLNERVVDELPALLGEKLAVLRGQAAAGPAAVPATGTPYDELRCGTAVADVLALPRVRGIVQSLVGPGPRYDHDFVHHLPAGHQNRQHLHPDAIVDSADPAFDVQLFYYPHEVMPGGGGTRYVPGTHLRRVTSTTTARYQHVVGERFHAGPAGTIAVFHHGLWHAGHDNPGPVDRWLYKLRLNPAVPQVRLWDTSDLAGRTNPPTDHVFAAADPSSVAAVLRRVHPWQSTDASRYDLVERVRLWRHLTGDPDYDVDHYLTRLIRPGADHPAADG